MKHFKVAAYITAYEDPIAVEACVAAIAKQSFPVEKIFIIDNSSFASISRIDRADVIIEAHPENLGVAGGLALGLQWAIDHGYDFLWTFDQDSIPAPDCLKLLLEKYAKLSQPNYRIGIVASTAIDPRTKQIVEGADYDRDQFILCKHLDDVEAYECPAPITSGSLISLAAVKTIAPPQLNLFIDGVDIEYGMRLVQKGFHNLIVPQAILHHKFGNPMKVRFLQKELCIQDYSALRYYYIYRNHTYLCIRYAQGWYRLTSCLRRVKYLYHTIVVILLYDPKLKLQKLWACLLGTFHGMQGRLGKTW